MLGWLVEYWRDQVSGQPGRNKELNCTSSEDFDFRFNQGWQEKTRHQNFKKNLLKAGCKGF